MTGSAAATNAPILTNQETAERLRVPLQTLAVWRMNGYGPRFFKAGRYVRYRLEDVEAWEREQVEASA
jgi:predicted site-specific integrase-resolvase